MEADALWSDGTKMWVLDREDVRVYDLETGNRDLVIEEVNIGNQRQADYRSDIWSDGATMWIAYRGQRPEHDRLYAYELTTGSRDSARDREMQFPRYISNSPRRKIWSDGDTLWMVEATRRHASQAASVYAYDWETGDRVPSRDFVLDRLNTNPTDLASDGTTMWVAEHAHLYAYDLATGRRDAARDFASGSVRGFDSRPLEGIDVIHSIWTDGRTMWVTHSADPTLYAYDLATRNRDPVRDYTSLLGEHWLSEFARVAGLWSDGRTLWVNDGYTRRVLAFDLARNHEPAKDWFVVDELIGGLWSDDGRTLWGFGESEFNAYDLDSSRARPRRLFSREGRPIAYVARGDDLWSDGAMMWIPAGAGSDPEATAPEGTAPKLYGFDWTRDDWSTLDLRRANREFALDPANINPSGLWSDGATMWVADAVDGKLYAYDWATGDRVRVKEFDTLRAAGNTVPGAIWSNGATMWVSNIGRSNAKLYAYDMPPGGRTFTDPVLEAGVTVFRAIHVTELRDRIDSLRIAYGLSAFSWTDPIILSGVTPIRAVHLTELRAALDQAYVAAGRTRPRYAEAMRAGGAIKALHVTELRRLVVALE